MKKLLTICMVILLSTSFTLAQDWGYHKGVNNLNLGIGFGALASYWGSTTIPPISVGVQFGIDQKISVGGIVGYTASEESWGYYNGNYTWKYSYILIGARGEYHFFEDRQTPIDLYGALTLGYEIVNVTTPSGYNYGGYSAGASSFLYGFAAGARYAFTPSFGAFAEVGYGLGIFTIGLNLKL